MLTFLFLHFILSETCDPKDELKEGLICCNYSICDKYCYKETCIEANKVWFCYEEGIGYFFAIKFLPSIIFFFIGFIIRYLYHENLIINCNINNRILVFNFDSRIRYIFCLFTDFITNIYLFLIINGLFCYKVLPWCICAIFMAVVYTELYFSLPYFLLKSYNVNKLNLKSINQFFYHLKYSLFKLWFTIFTLTGYLTVFDTVAFFLNKTYRAEYEKIYNQLYLNSSILVIITFIYFICHYAITYYN